MENQSESQETNVSNSMSAHHDDIAGDGAAVEWLRNRFQVGEILAIIAIVVASFVAGRISAPDSGAASSTDSTVTQTTSVIGEQLNSVVSLIQAKQYDAASQVLDQILSTEPKNATALYNKGVVAQYQGKNADADMWYTQSIASDDTNSSAYYNRGLARRDSGNLAGAAEDLTKADSMVKDWAAAKYNLGLVYVKMGQVDKGQALISAAQALNPNLGTGS